MAAPIPFLDLARSRRTARVHAPAPVAEAAIEAVLEAARWAPSAANRQPWEFVVMRDAKLKQALRAAFLAEAENHGAKCRSWRLASPRRRRTGPRRCAIRSSGTSTVSAPRERVPLRGLPAATI